MALTLAAEAQNPNNLPGIAFLEPANTEAGYTVFNLWYGDTPTNPPSNFSGLSIAPSVTRQLFLDPCSGSFGCTNWVGITNLVPNGKWIFIQSYTAANSMSSWDESITNPCCAPLQWFWTNYNVIVTNDFKPHPPHHVGPK